MAVAGDLADLGLPDLLYMFKMRGTTGRLVVQRGPEEAVLHLQQGRLVRVTSTQVSQRLGRLLVHLGKLTEDQLARTLQVQAQDGRRRPFGTLLVDQGLVSASDLDDVLRCQAEEILLRILAWSDGTFAFVPVDADRGLVPLPEINIDRIILESIRHADEWETIRARIPSLDCDVALHNGAHAGNGRRLSLKESIVLASVASGAATLREVAAATSMGEAELLRLAHGLVTRGILTVGEPGGARRTGARKRGRRSRGANRQKKEVASYAA